MRSLNLEGMMIAHEYGCKPLGFALNLWGDQTACMSHLPKKMDVIIFCIPLGL